MLDLGISGNELITYALIYGFSQEQEDQYFSASISFIMEWLQVSSKTTVVNILKRLVESGLIKKESKVINNITFNKYSAVVPENVTVVQKMVWGSTENVPNNNIDNNKESTHFVRTEEKQTNSKDWDLTFVRADYTPCVLEWLSHKKAIKKGYRTLSGVKKMYTNLVKLSNGSPEIAQMIVDQSIANNWDGLFALKGGGPTQSRMQQQMQDIHDRAKLSLNLLMEKEKERQNGRGNNSVSDFESIF
jgi:DNA-binding Lrp family transcriptional regulator